MKLIDNTSSISYPPLTVPETVLLDVSHAYTVKELNNVYEDFTSETITDDFYHHDWNDKTEDYKLRNDFIATLNTNTKEAIFLPKDMVTINAPITLQLRDPWRISNPTASPENWIQPNSFQSVSGSYDVFLNQNPDQGPHYSLKAPRYYADTEHIYELDGWMADPAADADFFSTEDPTVYNVVFKDEGVTVAPEYRRLNQIAGNHTISSDLSIPQGANISFIAGSRLTIEGNLTIGSEEGSAVYIQATSYNPNYPVANQNSAFPSISLPMLKRCAALQIIFEAMNFKQPVTGNG